MKTQQILGRLRHGKGRGAFTLIEVMITMAITALVASIAIPYFITYRSNAQAKACVSNLRSINHAKEQWAMETRKGPGDPCSLTDIIGPAAYIKNSVNCPTTAQNYDVGLVGFQPTCVSGISNHELPQ